MTVPGTATNAVVIRGDFVFGDRDWLVCVSPLGWEGRAILAWFADRL